jgi:hypothetical protein
MSSPFDPPLAEGLADADRAPLVSPIQDPHLVITAILMLIYGLPVVLLACMFPVAGLVGGLTDPDFSDIPGGFLFTTAIGAFEGLCIILVGALYVAAGASLFTGRKWAWVLALVAGALWVSNLCCLPFGAYVLFALLIERVRKAYGIG